MEPNNDEVVRTVRDLIARYSIGAIGEALMMICQESEDLTRSEGEPVQASAYDELGQLAYDIMNTADHYGV